MPYSSYINAGGIIICAVFHSVFHSLISLLFKRKDDYHGMFLIYGTEKVWDNLITNNAASRLHRRFR